MAAEHQDWRTQLQPGSRLRIIIKLMDTLKRHIPFSCPVGLLELTKIAIRYEEKVYTSGVTQSAYLRTISLKMLTMETRNQNNNNPMPNPLPLHPPNPDMNGVRWQTQFQEEYRQRIVSKILDTSVKYHPIWGPADYLEATEAAVRFETNVYTTATNEVIGKCGDSVVEDGFLLKDWAVSSNLTRPCMLEDCQ